jgi:hypothetical protein
MNRHRIASRPQAHLEKSERDLLPGAARPVTSYERGAADRRAAPRSGRRASAGPAPHRAPALWCYAAALSQPSLNPPNRSTHFRARSGQRERGSTPRRHAPRSRRGSRSCGGTVTIWGCFCPFVWRCDLSSCSGGTVRSERVRELTGGGGGLGRRIRLPVFDLLPGPTRQIAVHLLAGNRWSRLHT